MIDLLPGNCFHRDVDNASRIQKFSERSPKTSNNYGYWPSLETCTPSSSPCPRRRAGASGPPNSKSFAAVKLSRSYPNPVNQHRRQNRQFQQRPLPSSVPPWGAFLDASTRRPLVPKPLATAPDMVNARTSTPAAVVLGPMRSASRVIARQRRVRMAASHTGVVPPAPNRT